MSIRRSWSLRLLPFAAALAAAACSDSTAPRAPLDANTVATQDSALAQVSAEPALQSLIGSQSLGILTGVGRRTSDSPTPLLRRAGALVSLHAQPSTSALALRAAAVASAGFIDSAAYGKTYVMQSGQYVWDSTRTDAPANGARVVLYQRLPDGTFGTTPVGAIDFIDSTRDSLTTVGIVHIYDAQGASVGDWRLTDTQTASGDDATIQGAIGREGRQLLFADTVSAGSVESGGTSYPEISFALNTSAPFIDFAFHIGISISGASGSPIGRIDVHMALARHDVELTGPFPPDSTDTLRLAVDGTPTAIVTPDSGLRAADGSAPSPQLAELTSALFDVANRVPTGLLMDMALEEIASQLH